MAVKGGAADEIHELRRQLMLERQHNEALRKIISEFTPAARDILWCALVWNDHNFSYKELLAKANRAAKSLGFDRAGWTWADDNDPVTKANAWMARIDAVMGPGQTVNSDPA